tara:strand:- start:847624 stop:849855 length:2232 start_codon:yes stop_codon:yes gene_type:complete
MTTADEDDDVLSALKAHDETLERSGLCLWVGAEPTYTDRMSESPEWLFDALGDDKRKRADHILAGIAQRESGAAIMRSVGRQYGGEPLPRWSLGLYARRDGRPVWKGPPDPMSAGSKPPGLASPGLASPDPNARKPIAPESTLTASDSIGPSPADSVPEAISTCPSPVSLAIALAESLRSIGMTATVVDEPLNHRVVFRLDHGTLPTCAETEPQIARSSVHDKRVKDAEVFDALADVGTFLVCCDIEDGSLRVELPGLKDVDVFQQLLDALAEAADSVGAPTLILAGFPPPVDQQISWMTVTADPAVIEINTAPVARAAELLDHLRKLESVCDSEGLAPYRLQYTGEESDSGGGGQITLGGPSPEESPFLTQPSLLPGLIQYFNRHPSLSYLHAFESVGPASQAPRADEGVHDAISELSLALALLQRTENPPPEIIWGTLAPFLADPSGNSHRSEINIEKLWNPFLGTRGKLGLVEFRALRMGPSAETTASLAALLRSIAAMQAMNPRSDPLIDWKDELHQRFSLPYYLHRDIEEVLDDLESAGFGLGQPLVRHLLRDDDLIVSTCELGETTLEIRRAIEFWPLVGDVATQERGGSRLIDASTSRIEIRLRPTDDRDAMNDWSVSVDQWAIPLREEQDASGPARVVGLRYRSFVPQRGLHPTLGSQSPLSFCLSHPTEGSWQVTIHPWEPSGAAYPGLPATIDEARKRRRARCVIEKRSTPRPSVTTPPVEAIGSHVVDLRWK